MMMLDRLVTYLPQIKKAIIAGVGAGGAALGAVQVNGTTWAEWGYVIATGIGAAFLAWLVPNASTPTSSS
jgi:hypothetical protein